MGAAWRADEYRPVRAALVAASMAAWVLGFAWRDGVDGATHPQSFFVLMNAGVAVLLHLGVLLTMAVERHNLAVRVLAAVIALPVLAGSALVVPRIAETLLDGRRVNQVEALFALLFVLSCLQMWRSAGLRFPRWTPLAPTLRDEPVRTGTTEH